MHDHRRLVDQLGLEFGFRGDDAVHDVRPFLFQGDAQVGDFRLGLLLLPLQGVRPFVAFDPHLVHGHRVAVGRVLDVERGDPQPVDDAPHHAHQIGDIDAEGAVLGAALAQVAFGVGNDGGPADEFRAHPPFFLSISQMVCLTLPTGEKCGSLSWDR
jgi:hypothetical protein